MERESLSLELCPGMKACKLMSNVRKLSSCQSETSQIRQLADNLPDNFPSLNFACPCIPSAPPYVEVLRSSVSIDSDQVELLQETLHVIFTVGRRFKRLYQI